MVVPAIVVLAALVAAQESVVPLEYPHVRMPQPRLARLVASAAERSPTFASLLRRLQNTDVVIFVMTSTSLAPRITGRTMLVNVTSAVRYLQADVRADAPEAEIIGTIAHELQHAIEIAGSAVRDERGLAKLYQTIGERHARGFDSNDARMVGTLVQRELSQNAPKLVAQTRPGLQGPIDDPLAVREIAR